MFREDMGACNDGCKCQSCWRVTIENGEVVVDYDRETPTPCHLHPLQNALDKCEVVKKDSNYYFEWDAVASSDDDMDLFQHHTPKPLEVVEVNGVKYYRERCRAFYWEPFEFEDEAKKLADGEYNVTREYACFSNYNWEYGVDERDSDVVFEIEPIKDGE
jgi:hypothetical protein